jgi:hypothetical protein
LIVGLAVIVVVAIMRRRRQLPVAAAIPTATSAMATPANIQMSADGRFWWDGQGWKDTEVEVPPNVQRSADGGQWWDGRGWRPVPR